ncbi:MAG TPA: HD domain-containing protein [Candidatus Paceibacterota bacterium]
MEKDFNRIAQFLYEVGSMRRIPRMHRQNLLVDDTADNIASHSYRVAFIGWHLAKKENADPYKVVMMCLLHDIGEVRSGDQNWVHKRYTKVFDEEILEDQLGTLPFSDLKEFATEYEKRESKESIIAKDADLIDQILLLKEYEWQGNKEATEWLRGKGDDTENRQFTRLQLDSSKKLVEEILSETPSSWWKDLFTDERRV